jgi:hypothetical protein
VRQVPQGGWRCTAPAGCAYSAVTIASGASVTGRDFGDAQSTTVSGTKYADHDRDGTRDADEPGLSGWTVYVDYDGDGVLGPLEPSAVTDANGDYTISRINPNTAANPYAVREVAQADWTCSAPAGCAWTGFVIVGGTSVTGRDFGAYRAQSVSGRTYEDRDADGTQDAGDPALGGMTLWAETVADNGTIDPGEPTATSDARGDYLIPDVPVGTFRVRQAPRAGWTCSVAGGCFRTFTLTPGGTAPGNDFGSYRPATVSGTAFDDADRDGSRGVDELAAPGVTVVVETVSENGVADPGEPTAVTGADGAYSIGGLAPRTTPYRVVGLPPAGHTCTFPGDCDHHVTLLSGDVAEDRDFGVVAESRVSGTQFEDRDADGVRDGGEPGLSGWTVWVDYDNDGARDSGEPSDVTAASGDYAIDGVRLGSFRVRQEPTAGWTCSFPDSCSWRVDFVAGGDVGGRDFGAWEPGSVSGRVFDDLDRGGNEDGGEPGLSPWIAFVDYDGDEVRDGDEPHATTAGDGTYTIPGVRPGRWAVREELQGQYACTTPVPCENDVTVASGDDTPGADFGNAVPGVTIEGSVFHDRDADGAARPFDAVSGEPAEPGLGGRQVWLETVAANGVLDPGEPSTVSNDSGDYGFRNLNPGSYAVRHEAADGWNCSYPATCGWSLAAAAGEAVVAQDFGEWTSPSISGRLYEDLNADGGADAGEPAIAGRTVALDPGTPGDASDDASTTSAADGTYGFGGLTPSVAYRVYDAGPAGWTCSQPGAACEYAVTLGSGDASDGNDFGLWRAVTIAGTKYEDTNADGDRDSGEPALGGRTIKLDPATPGNAGDDLSATTAPDGSYSFSGLTPGVTYRVHDEGESGWTCSEPGSPCEYSVPTASGDGVIGGNDFGAYRPASIAGTSYEDSDADGSRDAGEPANGGRTVYIDADGSDSLSAGDPTTTSAPDGSYSFAGLRPGSYSVREQLPSAAWTCSAPAGCEHAVTLGSGEAVSGRDFGSWRPATISGTKYEDTDGDGERDGGEPPIPGKTIVLDPCTPDDPSDDLTTTTAADGSYSFSGLTPGVAYCVRDAGEPGWTCTDPGAGCEHTITPGSGETPGGRDFGAYRPASIAGTSYEDSDADGSRDAGEPANGGRTVYIDADGSDSLSAGDPTTTSAPDGSYSFAGLRPGSYSVREQLPSAAWTCSAPAGCEHAVTLGSGEAVSGRDFGSWRPATISGTKYEDTDGDGERDGGEPPIPGKTIVLDPCTPDDPSDDLTTTTAADGSYSFSGLTPGVAYCVRDAGEPGWTCTDPGAGCEHTITPGSGETPGGRDFGAYRPASIAGTSYEDSDADGSRDAGEPANGGRTVYIDADGSDSLSAGDPTTTSAPDGSYSFAGLRPGSYSVREQLPSAAWTCSAPAGCEHAVTLGSGEAVSGRDFGSWRPATISGTKYEDTDGDGERDGGEPPIPGKTIVLDPCTPDDPSDDLTTTTAADGSYSFSGLTPGVAYCVRDAGEPGWTCTDPGAGCEHTITPGSGETPGGRDFGAYRQPVLEVRQVLDPITDGGRFDLSIDGSVRKGAARHGESSGRTNVTPGDHTVAHAPAAPTSAADYDSTLECRADGGSGAVVASTGGSVTLASGDDVLCVFTSAATRSPARGPAGRSPQAARRPPVDECGAEGAKPAGSTTEGCDEEPDPPADEPA